VILLFVGRWLKDTAFLASRKLCTLIPSSIIGKFLQQCLHCSKVTLICLWDFDEVWAVLIPDLKFIQYFSLWSKFEMEDNAS
jgi:hypothetical protein